MDTMKKIAKRFVALTMSLLLVAIMAVSAFAYDEKNVQFKRSKEETYITWTTGNTLAHFFGKKKTYLIIRNTSKSEQTIYFELDNGKWHSLSKNQAVAFECVGFNKKHTVHIWVNGGVGITKSVRVTTDSGSFS